MTSNPSDDLSNLGIEADETAETRHMTATAEEAVLRQVGLLPANLNVNIRDPLERNRVADTVARNILTAIQGTRSALTYNDLRRLLDPSIQTALETVARPEAHTLQETTTLVLAQALYEVLPKEVWHVIVERRLETQFNGGTNALPHTADYAAALKFYESLRRGNDANDMQAGMAVLLAMQTNPDPKAWESAYVNGKQNAERQGLTNRKNVAETVQQFKTIQPITLPSGMAQSMNRVDVQNALDDIRTGPTSAYARLDAAIATADGDNQAYEQRMVVYKQAIADWKHNSAERKIEQEHNRELTNAHRQECDRILKEHRQECDRIQTNYDRECERIQSAFHLNMQAYNMLLANLNGSTPPPAPTPPVVPPVPVMPPVPAMPIAPTIIPPRAVGAEPPEPRPVPFIPITLTGAVAAAINNVDAARTKRVELQAIEKALEVADNEFAARERMLINCAERLQQLNIPNVERLFPQLFLVCTGTPPTIVPGAVTANFNFAGIAAEIERNIPGGLKTLEQYATELGTTQQNPEGPAVTLAVYRAYIKREHPSLSDADVDQVANYILNRTKVDGILRSSVDHGMEEYLNLGERTWTDWAMNSAFNWNDNEYMSRASSTVCEIARSTGIPMLALPPTNTRTWNAVAPREPDWQAATYEQASTAYFAIKELIDGKGPDGLSLKRKPEAAVNAFRTLSRILSTRYAGKIEQKLTASLSEDQKKAVLKSRAKTADTVKKFLLGDTPEWLKEGVKKAHERANHQASWVSRDAYWLGGVGLGKAKKVGSWMLGKGGKAIQKTGDVVKKYGKDAAAIAGLSLLGGPVLGIAAWYAMKQFSGKKAAPASH